MELDVDFGALVADLALPTLRMVDLARALAREPRLLLLDEITAALPSDLAERVFVAMRDQRERGRSVLFISHRLNEVIRACDRATILRDGGAVATIVPEEGGEELIVTHMLGEEVARAAAKAAEQPMTLRRVREKEAETPSLEVDGLTTPGVHGISFASRPPARCSGSPPWRARARTSCSTRSPVPFPPRPARSASRGRR